MAMAVRSVSWQAATPQETAMTSVATPFLQAHRLFDGDLVEGVHAHLDVGQVHAAAVGLDADLDVVVHHAFDGDEKVCAPDSDAERGARLNARPAARELRQKIERSCFLL
jgi:hypothetical protein